jgi:predicted dehydrogenase
MASPELAPSPAARTKAAAKTRTIRFGLIGVGGVGSVHRAAIHQFETAGAAKLIAVADPHAGHLGTEKAALESNGVRWHLDYREMLRHEPDLDAVVIATPIPYHFEMAQACLERGIYVHMEKPPTPMLHQLESLIAQDPLDKVSVGFQLIGAQCLQSLKQMIADGALGELVSIRAGCCWPRTDRYYNRAGWAGRMVFENKPVFDGPATNAMAHVIHNIMYLAGESRHGFGLPIEVKGELYRARAIESYDTAFLGGTFPAGINFSVALTHATRQELLFKIMVQGTKGWARLSEDGARLESSVGIACERSQSTQELIDLNYANFLGVLNGDQKRFNSCLKDTRGYVAATNAMLVSSQGIHQIDPKHFTTYNHAEDRGLEVFGLREAVEETVRTGKSFGEQGLPWASATPNIYPITPELSLAELGDYE